MSVESQTSRNSPVMMVFRKQSSCSNDSGSDKHWDFRSKQSPLNGHIVPEHTFCCWLKQHGRTPMSHPNQEPQRALHGSLSELWSVLFTQTSAQWHLLQELLKGTDPQTFPRFNCTQLIDTTSTYKVSVPKKCPVATDVPCSNPSLLENPSHG